MYRIVLKKTSSLYFLSITFNNIDIFADIFPASSRAAAVSIALKLAAGLNVTAPALIVK